MGEWRQGVMKGRNERRRKGREERKKEVKAGWMVRREGKKGRVLQEREGENDNTRMDGRTVGKKNRKGK